MALFTTGWIARYSFTRGLPKAVLGNEQEHIFGKTRIRFYVNIGVQKAILVQVCESQQIISFRNLSSLSLTVAYVFAG
jgi:hypothetical protein